MAETRRGRISQATYTRVVGQMLTRDWFALEQCEVLTQLEAVESLVAAFPDRFLSKGWAVRALLDKAIGQVIAASRASTNERTQRIARYLEERQAGRSVAEIATMWGLTRECVSRTVGRQATTLVTERLLVLGRRAYGKTQSGEIPGRPATNGAAGPKRTA